MGLSPCDFKVSLGTVQIALLSPLLTFKRTEAPFTQFNPLQEFREGRENPNS